MMETEVSITGPIHFYGIFPLQEYFSKNFCFDRYDSYLSTIGVCVIFVIFASDRKLLFIQICVQWLTQMPLLVAEKILWKQTTEHSAVHQDKEDLYTNTISCTYIATYFHKENPFIPIIFTANKMSTTPINFGATVAYTPIFTAIDICVFVYAYFQ